MRKYNLILLLILYPICLYSQQQENIIREDAFGNDTVVWKGSESSNLISVYVKEDNDSTHRCRQRIPKGMKIEVYEDKYQDFAHNYIASNLDLLVNAYLNYLPKKTMNTLLRSSSKHPMILHFRINKDGEIFSVTVAMRKDVKAALNSSKYYRFQNLLKTNIVFKAPSSYGLTGCLRFSMPIRKDQLRRKLSASKGFSQ